mmetsp:Transcript_15067/g.16703  ORF Transcript_15067/g.16703 Transcript_15067/m.16703 type:complete len:613 (+) Transcript_15067:62-1900(+)
MPFTNRYDENLENKSSVSYRSNQSRSSVMERARAYNRRIEEDQQNRAKSAERSSDHQHSNSGSNSVSERAKSTGRQQSKRFSMHERALASVQKDSYRMNQEKGETSHESINDISNKNRFTKEKNETQMQQCFETKATQSPIDRSRGAHQEAQNNNNEQQEAIVSPELLVDALSGHEDGLLAIAERLMEHYDAGYDVMGESIIDAFADVQKLFQHVVEAAHMEGAAFEATRREAEIAELRKQIGGVNVTAVDNNNNIPDTPSGGGRHDEIVDQDVKDILSEAVRKGSTLVRDTKRHIECFQLYEHACQSASSLLPVDSDHRGRLQMSIARSESMSPDRACAILRYAMDDVMRSRLRAGPPPDISKRSDMWKPQNHPIINGKGQPGGGVVIQQSSEEALASLVEEMKEIMSAPVYKNTPLQSVAERFWVALEEAQRSQLKNEERLEQSLGKLKGEFLMAKAEWEEKLTASQEHANQLEKRYIHQKETLNGEIYVESDRSKSSKWGIDRGEGENINPRDPTNRASSGSVVSIGSGLAQSARSIVGTFNCTGINERSGPLVASELQNETIPSIRRNKSYDPSMNKSSSFSLRNSRPPSKPLRGRSSTQRSYQLGSM